MKYLKTTLLVTALLSLSTRSYVVHAENTVPDLTTLDTVSHVLSEERFVGDILKQQEDVKKQIEEEMMRQTTEYREKIEQERINVEQIEQERVRIEYGYDSLNNFLLDTGFEGMGEYFVDVSEEYNVPLHLLVPISAWETGWFTSWKAVNTYNFGGVRCSERADYCVDGFSAYNSLEQGLADKAFLLRTYYLDEGLDTLEEIQPKYCPIGDGCDDWLTGVSSIQEDFIASCGGL